MEFEKFPSIGRLKKGCTITEKIDGTNAQICFGEQEYSDGDIPVLIGSRKRQIFPEGAGVKGCDNYGFAQWVMLHVKELHAFLGEGRHYGEWAGHGIQRNYGLKEKRFYLFNSMRYREGQKEIPPELKAIGLDVVPVLYEGDFSSTTVDETMSFLKEHGSFIADYMNPEGVIIYHHGVRTYFKTTFDHDVGKCKIK